MYNGLFYNFDINYLIVLMGEPVRPGIRWDLGNYKWMNAEISETMRHRLLGFGMQIPVLLMQLKFVAKLWLLQFLWLNKHCGSYSFDARKKQNCGFYSFDGRTKISYSFDAR